MLPILPSEADANTVVETLRKQIAERRQNRPNYGWNATPEQEAELEVYDAETAALTEQFEEATKSTDFMLYALKTELSQQIAEALPGGDFNALLTIAEQMEMSLDGETATRIGGIIKNLIVRLFNFGADSDLNTASAKVTRASYTALVDAGFTEDEALKIVVAKASRPIGFGSPVSASRNK